MAKLELYPVAGKYSFRFKSTFSGQLLESILFDSKSECNNAMRFFQKNAQRDSIYQYHSQSPRKHWFTIIDNQGQQLAHSEPFTSRHALEIGVNTVKNEAKAASLLDLT